MKIYVFGCTRCGSNRSLIKAVRKVYPEVQVYDSRLSKKLLTEHTDYLREAGMNTSVLNSIVVNDKTITLLSVFVKELN